MNRWLQIALGCMALCGFTPLACWLVPAAPEATYPFPHKTVGPASIEDVTSIASALRLYFLASPSGATPHFTVIISAEPLSGERLNHLHMHNTDFDRWRGVVSISLDGRERMRHNFDPAHPERFALWGKVFVYGDSELIAKLRFIRILRTWVSGLAAPRTSNEANDRRGAF
jgi:hypothetical protein